MKYGVIITRAQPLHIGHVKVIKKALEENDKVLLIIGSADKSMTERNPFSIDLRWQQYLQMLCYYKWNFDQIKAIKLPDWSADKNIPYDSNVGSDNQNYKTVAKEWRLYLYYNIVGAIGQKDFTLYYNDDPAIIKEWFPDYIWDRITLKSMERDDISSSKVRTAIVTDNITYLKETVPYLSSSDINSCRRILQTIQKGRK